MKNSALQYVNRERYIYSTLFTKMVAETNKT